MSDIQGGAGKAKVLVFGGGGHLGSQIVGEALRRGHTVTVATPNPDKIPNQAPDASVVAADVTVAEDVLAAVAGQDVVISAVGPSSRSGAAAGVVSDAARVLLAALPKAGVERLVVLGATGTLEVAPGVQLVDLPEFPSEHREVARAHRDALDVFRGEDGNLQWTVVTPPAAIMPGPRTGNYRIGKDSPLGEDGGRINAEDLACAVLDEVESPSHIRQRFTVAQ